MPDVWHSTNVQVVTADNVVLAVVSDVKTILHYALYSVSFTLIIIIIIIIIHTFLSRHKVVTSEAVVITSSSAMADRPCDCLRPKSLLCSCQHCQWFSAG